MKPNLNDVVTLAELAELVAKPSRTLRQRLFNARKAGTLKNWRRSGGVILLDKSEALKIAMKPDGRGRPRKGGSL